MESQHATSHKDTLQHACMDLSNVELDQAQFGED